MKNCTFILTGGVVFTSLLLGAVPSKSWGQKAVLHTDSAKAFVVSYQGKHYAMSRKELDKESGLSTGHGLAPREVKVAGEKVINAWGDSILWDFDYVRDKSDTAFACAYIKPHGDEKNYLYGSEDGGDLRVKEGNDTTLWLFNDTLSLWFNYSLYEKESYRSFFIEPDKNTKTPSFRGWDIAHLSGDTHEHSSVSMSEGWVLFSDAYVRENLDSASYGTICLPRSVAANDYSGATFYSIAGKDKGDTDSLLYLTKVDSLVKGTPYIFFTNDTILTVAYHDMDSVTSAVKEGTNGLMGNLQDDNLAVDPGRYMIDDNQVKECGTGCKLAKNRAYIDMSEVPVGKPQGMNNILVISIGGSIGGTTHVAAVTADSDKVDVYTIGGVMVRRKAEAATATAGLQKGIYIVNHKKVAVK